MNCHIAQDCPIDIISLHWVGIFISWSHISNVSESPSDTHLDPYIGLGPIKIQNIPLCSPSWTWITDELCLNLNDNDVAIYASLSHLWDMSEKQPKLILKQIESWRVQLGRNYNKERTCNKDLRWNLNHPVCIYVEEEKHRKNCECCPVSLLIVR